MFYRRLVLTAIDLGRATPEALAAVYSVLTWSFKCLAEGTWPLTDHLGSPLVGNRQPRYRFRGEPLFGDGWIGILSEIRGLHTCFAVFGGRGVLARSLDEPTHEGSFPKTACMLFIVVTVVACHANVANPFSNEPGVRRLGYLFIDVDLAAFPEKEK